jgi:hypothetical protein
VLLYFARLDPKPILLLPCPLACRSGALQEHLEALASYPFPCFFKISNKKTYQLFF